MSPEYVTEEQRLHQLSYSFDLFSIGAVVPLLDSIWRSASLVLSPKTVRPMKLFFVGLAALSLAGCRSPVDVSPGPLFDDPTVRWANLTKACPSNAAAVPLSADKRIALSAGSSRTIDDMDAEVARKIPGGWGGRFFLENGTTNMFLVDPSQKDAAIAALNATGIAVTADINVRQGRWDFGQLYDWYHYVLANSLQSVAWSGTDIQEARNRIEIAVINEGERSKLEAKLSSLGIPCYLVAIYIRGYATATSK
jgi:hypothetical protein